MAQVRIYRPAKTAMQSGKGQTHSWMLEYEPATRRDPDPLMGWASAADTLNEVHLRFDTLEEAIGFATRRGLDYVVCAPKEARFKAKSYADNFRYDRPRRGGVE
ncbi:MAG TPA: ETC complex I subunit [Stellaceae bacterium]|nr:ETC complex I subunit [Stellaceae bacterium]